MHLIAPGIATNVAYGTCMLLFGLLVLSVRNRKAAARIPYTFYASPERDKARPAPKKRPAQNSRRATIPAQQSAILLNAGPENAPREWANPVAPKSSLNSLAAPPETPALQISDEVKMNSPSFPFEHLDPIVLSEIPAFVPPPTASASPVYGPALPAAYGAALREERSAHEIAVADSGKGLRLKKQGKELAGDTG